MAPIADEHVGVCRVAADDVVVEPRIPGDREHGEGLDDVEREGGQKTAVCDQRQASPRQIGNEPANECCEVGMKQRLAACQAKKGDPSSLQRRQELVVLRPCQKIVVADLDPLVAQRAMFVAAVSDIKTDLHGITCSGRLKDPCGLDELPGQEVESFAENEFFPDGIKYGDRPAPAYDNGANANKVAIRHGKESQDPSFVGFVREEIFLPFERFDIVRATAKICAKIETIVHAGNSRIPGQSLPHSPDKDDISIDQLPKIQDFRRIPGRHQDLSGISASVQSMDMEDMGVARIMIVDPTGLRGDQGDPRAFGFDAILADDQELIVTDNAISSCAGKILRQRRGREIPSVSMDQLFPRQIWTVESPVQAQFANDLEQSVMIALLDTRRIMKEAAIDPVNGFDDPTLLRYLNSCPRQIADLLRLPEPGDVFADAGVVHRDRDLEARLNTSRVRELT